MNAVTERAHEILKRRGLTIESCTHDQLKSAYDKAEMQIEREVLANERMARAIRRAA